MTAAANRAGSPASSATRVCVSRRSSSNSRSRVARSSTGCGMAAAAHVTPRKDCPPHPSMDAEDREHEHSSVSDTVRGLLLPALQLRPNQWIPPTPSMPFHKVSALFVAFAHAYPDPNDPNGALLMFEQGQALEPERLLLLTTVARAVNPGIKILISLGWSAAGSDWAAINTDAQGTNEFAGSVVSFILQHELDGFDIDDESVSNIDQPTFDRVMQNLRNALDAASAQDGKPYYLTIIPAGGTAQVTATNRMNFDLINLQCYGGSLPGEFVAIGCPRSQLAWGIDSEDCNASFPTPAEYQGLAGIFNWTMSADHACGFRYTSEIASAVGYGRAARIPCVDRRRCGATSAAGCVVITTWEVHYNSSREPFSTADPHRAPSLGR
jgi:hypothetical protein